jgi:threonine dehydratase
MKSKAPHVKVYGVEPITAAPLARSLQKGEVSSYPEFQKSFVEGTSSSFPSLASSVLLCIYCLTLCLL